MNIKILKKNYFLGVDHKCLGYHMHVVWSKSLCVFGRNFEFFEKKFNLSSPKLHKSAIYALTRRVASILTLYNFVALVIVNISYFLKKNNFCSKKSHNISFPTMGKTQNFG